MKKFLIHAGALTLALIMCVSCTSCVNVHENEIPPEKILAEKMLAEMTLEQKVGQLFLLHGYDVLEYNLPAAEEYNAGGVILFAGYFENSTPGTARAGVETLQAASAVPLFIGVDEEGGVVSRVSLYPQFRSSGIFKSPRQLMESGGEELVRSDTDEKCELLKSLGINLNLAPVSDVSTNEKDFIYARSAGNADSTEIYVRAFVEQSVKNSVGSCLKHFPGYGDNEDTHIGVAVDKRPYERFENSDFIPVKAGIEAGVGLVMVSHNIVECMDADNPASLSGEVHRILRQELGFGGIAISDDLGMDAIATQYGIGEAAVKAIECGNDMITTSNLAEQYEAVLEAVQSGRISVERIDESVLRILEYKIQLGIITEPEK